MVSSSRDTVFLRWERIRLTDVIGVRLYRMAAFEAGFRQLAQLPPEASRFDDVNVEAGVEYAYQITAMGADFESMRSDTVRVEPGPTFNWVAENPGASNRLLKLTHDSRHVMTGTSGFLTIIDIEPNLRNGQVWVIDFITPGLGQVIRVSARGQVVLPFLNLAGPRDAAIVLETGSLWVANAHDSSVVKLNVDGEMLFSERNFIRPVSVAVDQRTGACWVADGGRNEVVRLGPDGSERLVSAVAFQAVAGLATNSADGSVWVSDKTRVLKLDDRGEPLLEIANDFTDARKLAVNDSTGAVWMINWNPSTVSKFRQDGQKAFELPGFNRPADLAINLFDDSCLVADTENHRLVKISSEGQQVSVVQKLTFPSAVAVQNEMD